MANGTAAPANELQTLLVTLQQTNVQLGNIARAIGDDPAKSLAITTMAQILGFTSDAAAAAGGVPLWGLYINLNTTPYTLAVRHV